MIVTLRLEAIGDNYRRLDAAPLKRTLYEVRRRSEHAQRLLDPKMRPWVAEITGLHRIRGLERSFLNGMRDYRDANSSGSRGVYLTFVLYEGRIYEVQEVLSWSRKRRYLCRVEQGRVVEMALADVALRFGASAAALQDLINRAAKQG